MKCPPDTQFLKCIQDPQGPIGQLDCNLPASTKYSYCVQDGDICRGEVEGDEYIIDPYSNKGYIPSYFDPPVIEELTQEGLTKWKSMGVSIISEE